MPLSLKQLNDVCLFPNTNYKRCRYLGQDDIDGSKWYCMKKTAKRAEIDDESNEYLADCHKKGIDPRSQSVPLGDNCPGYPILKTIEQGYDKDKI
jgi:hypothetical protein